MSNAHKPGKDYVTRRRHQRARSIDANGSGTQRRRSVKPRSGSTKAVIPIARKTGTRRAAIRGTPELKARRASPKAHPIPMLAPSGPAGALTEGIIRVTQVEERAINTLAELANTANLTANNAARLFFSAGQTLLARRIAPGRILPWLAGSKQSWSETIPLAA